MDMSNFVERLSELVSDTEKTAEQIGDEIGCGNSTISHYLTGRFYPTLDMTVRMANYFKCTVDFLLGVTDKNEFTEIKDCPPFGKRLDKLCKNFKMSRYKLRQQTNISESTMRYWVEGKTKPSIVNIVKIANEFGCSIEFVLGREN